MKHGPSAQLAGNSATLAAEAGGQRGRKAHRPDRPALLGFILKAKDIHDQFAF